MKAIQNIFIGKNPIQLNDTNVSGTEVLIGDEVFYKISNVDSMRPFFMSIVSNSNHWLFISSTGGLSAGRKIVIMLYFHIILMIKSLSQATILDQNQFF